MTMPHERLRSFLWAGQILRAILSNHPQKWGVSLPEGLVHEARMTLRHYPTEFELRSAARVQRDMKTWIAEENLSMGEPQDIFDQLKAVVLRASVGDSKVVDPEGHLAAWLWTPHPALGYQSPTAALDTIKEPLKILRLLRIETEVITLAKEVFDDEAEAWKWMWNVQGTIKGLPLALIATDAGFRRVMAELVRIRQERTR